MAQDGDGNPKDVSQREEEMDNEDATDNCIDDVVMAVNGGPTPESAQRRRTKWDDDQHRMQ